ncbi:MAG: PIN domain nuclease [Acidimicrobiia bacterium]|nr:PIN domain nuclease [Acidimicrobiia bacterium]
MIAVDSSSLVEYLSGASGPDVEALDVALAARTVHLPPVVLTEVLSKPTRRVDAGAFLRSLPMLELKEGYWARAGELRARVVGTGRKAPLPDTLIAQVCLDHDVPLITRDADFKHFVRFGLKLFA